MKTHLISLLLIPFLLYLPLQSAFAYSGLSDKNNTSTPSQFAVQDKDFRRSTKLVTKLDRQAERMKRTVRNTKTKVAISGNSYYVSNNGNDDNDGRSPAFPFKSLEKVNTIQLQEGDAVFFNRGDLWRGRVQTSKGVTYSAYGKGDKPRIYGSPCNAAQEGKWLETDAPNVYMFDRELTGDIGTLVFNEGESCAFKVMKDKQKNGTTVHIETRMPFSDYRDLRDDLEFYHDYKEAKRVYLYSAKGNPAQRFHSIELLVKTHIIYATDQVVVDNLCLKYCGAHGVGSGTTEGLTVTNCEIGWIGGSIQAEDIFGRSHPTRFGNAIEIYGGCDYFLVDNCYIYQAYDAGITHQFSTGEETPIHMKNVTYSNNLVEDCVYGIEYFLGSASNNAERYMENILFKQNLLRRSGYGWGKQRPDKDTPAHIKSWTSYNRAHNFLIQDNIFDRSTKELLNMEAEQKEWLPTLNNNTYIQHIDIPAGKLGAEKTTYPFDSSIKHALKDIFGEKRPKIYFMPPYE